MVAEGRKAQKRAHTIGSSVALWVAGGGGVRSEGSFLLLLLLEVEDIAEDVTSRIRVARA